MYVAKAGGFFFLVLGALAVIAGIAQINPSWITGDQREHHILDRPRNAPTRTAFGVAWPTAYFVVMIAGGNDVIATRLHLSLNAIT